MRLEGPEPRHELTLVYRQECPEIVRHPINRDVQCQGSILLCEHNLSYSRARIRFLEAL